MKSATPNWDIRVLYILDNHPPGKNCANSPRHGDTLTAGGTLRARLILSWLVLAISIVPSYAESSLQTDQSGYTTGTVGSRSVNTYTDRYGNTTGWIGGNYTSTYSDGYGGTTGTIGNKRINTYEDGYGNTTGTIGRDRVNFQADRSGNITGTIGRRRLNCHTDRFRTTTCY